MRQHVRRVRYFTLDYHRLKRLPEVDQGGPRIVDDKAEWQSPTWLYDGFDAIDHGLELTTDSGVTFSLTWDLPGNREGIGRQCVPMLEALSDTLLTSPSGQSRTAQ